MLSLRKTRQAEADLLNIWDYTYETWGEAQAGRYLNMLYEAMTQLTRTPLLGKPRNDVRDGYRSIQAGRHVVFYLLHEGAIQVIRVLHDRMDPNRQLDDGHEE